MPLNVAHACTFTYSLKLAFSQTFFELCSESCRLRPFASNQDCCVIYFFLCFLRGVGRSGLKHFKTSNDCPDYGILYWRYLWCVCVFPIFSARTQDLIRVHTYLYNLIISTLHVELKKCILRCLISRPPFFPKARLGVYSSFSSYSTFSSRGQTVNNVFCTFKSNNMTHYHTLDKL